MAITELPSTPDIVLSLPTTPTPTWCRRVLPGGGVVSDLVEGRTVEIRLAGEMDTYDVDALRDLFTAVMLETNARLVHVAADDLTFVDLRILQLIADVRGLLLRSGRHLLVTGLHGAYAIAWEYATAAPTRPGESLAHREVVVLEPP